MTNIKSSFVMFHDEDNLNHDILKLNLKIWVYIDKTYNNGILFPAIL